MRCMRMRVLTCSTGYGNRISLKPLRGSQMGQLTTETLFCLSAATLDTLDRRASCWIQRFNLSQWEQAGSRSEAWTLACDRRNVKELLGVLVQAALDRPLSASVCNYWSLNNIRLVMSTYPLFFVSLGQCEQNAIDTLPSIFGLMGSCSMVRRREIVPLWRGRCLDFSWDMGLEFQGLQRAKGVFGLVACLQF